MSTTKRSRKKFLLMKLSLNLKFASLATQMKAGDENLLVQWYLTVSKDYYDIEQEEEVVNTSVISSSNFDQFRQTCKLMFLLSVIIQRESEKKNE